MATVRIDPSFLVRPKERTLEGVCQYLAADEDALRREEAKAKPDQAVLEELRHRVRVLQLKKDKFERMRDDKKLLAPGLGSRASPPISNSSSAPVSRSASVGAGGSEAGAGPGGGSSGSTETLDATDSQTLLLMRAKTARKESTDTLDRANPDLDGQTTELLANAMSLIGNSVDLTRFMAHFSDDHALGNAIDYDQAKVIYSISAELEKFYGFGDELLAKQIYMTGTKCKDEAIFEEAVKAETGMELTYALVASIYNIISVKESSDFNPDELVKRLEQVTEAVSHSLENLSASLAEDRTRLLNALVQAVGDWGELLEQTDKIKNIAALDDEAVGLGVLSQSKKRLGRHIGNLFSAVSFATSSSVEGGAWNLEQATAMLDEAVKSVWRVTTELAQQNLEMVMHIKESMAKDGKKGRQQLGRADSSRDINVAKLEKFFGANVGAVVQRKDKYEYVIAESRFDKNLFYNMEGQIKGGSLEKLVEKLTHHINYEEAYFKAFLVSFPTFTSIPTLVDLLEKRINLAVPDTLTNEERQYYIERKAQPIKDHVVKTTRAIIEIYFDTISADPEALNRLKIFIRDTIQHAMPEKTQVLEQALLKGKSWKALYDILEPSSPTKKEQVPKPIIVKSLKRGDILMVNMDPTEVARQLCLIDSAMFAQIEPQEFVRLAWSKKETAHRAPNIIKIINRSTELTSLVCHTILDHTDFKLRSETLKTWINVADKCRQLGNFNSLVAINAGLVSSSIHRLQRCWRAMTRKEMTAYEEVKTLMSYQRNFGAYRKALRGSPLPALPFLGLFLTDLTFIEDGNKNTLANSEFINFDKRMKFAKVVLEILSYQRVKYNFEVVKEMEEYFTNIKKYTQNEEEFYQLSLRVEKKESESDVLARVLADSGFL